MKLNKKGGAFGIFFLLILLVLLAGSLYVLYLSLAGKPVEYDSILNDFTGAEEEFVNYSSSKQFYENMRFKDKRISYKIEPACDSKKALEVKEAFSILESRTVLDFYPSASGNLPEITIFCSEVEPEPSEEGYFVAGEGGPTEVINTTLYGVIFFGKISFFREEKCDKPNVALHELLHVLGFDHNENPKSILFPTLDCNQIFDDSIVDDINNLYSADSAADLKIVDVSAIKSGRYLDFDIEVVNQGLEDAENVSLSVYSDDKFVKEFELGDIDIGVTKTLDVNNLNLGLFGKSRKVTFIVDEGNVIAELSIENNRAELTLRSE